MEIDDSSTYPVVKALSILQTGVITTPAASQISEITIEMSELNEWAKLMTKRSLTYDS